jgi:hypothetical protein
MVVISVCAADVATLPAYGMCTMLDMPCPDGCHIPGLMPAVPSLHIDLDSMFFSFISTAYGLQLATLY